MRRGAHGLEIMTLPPNDVFLSLHRVFLGRVKFGEGYGDLVSFCFTPPLRWESKIRSPFASCYRFSGLQESDRRKSFKILSLNGDQH